MKRSIYPPQNKDFFFGLLIKKNFQWQFCIIHQNKLLPANNLYKQRHEKPILPGWRHIIHSYPRTVLQAAAHTADIHGNKEEAQIEECRFEQKSITNNFNCFLDSSCGNQAIPQTISNRDELLILQKLVRAIYTWDWLFAFRPMYLNRVGRRWQGSTPSPALISCLIRNLLSTETTAPYNPMS